MANLHIKDERFQQLETRAKEAGFDSVDDYVDSLIQADLGESKEEYDEDLENLLLDRLNDPNPSIEVTPEFIANFYAQLAQRRRARGA